MAGSAKFLFRSFSIYQFYKYFFLRLVFLAILGLAIWLYDNNHVVMTFFVVIGLTGFLFVGENELKIYPSRICYSVDSIITLRKARKSFLIKDVKTFEVKGEFDVSTDVSSDLQNFGRSVYISYQSDPYNFIEIGLKDGSIVTIQTHIYIGKLKKAEGIMHRLLDDTAEINPRKDTRIRG